MIMKDNLQATREICKLFGFAFEEVMDYKLDQGRAYAERYCEGARNPEFFQMLMNSADYWLWYMAECAKRDIRLLANACLMDVMHNGKICRAVLVQSRYLGYQRVVIDRKERWSFYQTVQDQKEQKWWPNTVILERAYRDWEEACQQQSYQLT